MCKGVFRAPPRKAAEPEAVSSGSQSCQTPLQSAVLPGKAWGPVLIALHPKSHRLQLPGRQVESSPLCFVSVLCAHLTFRPVLGQLQTCHLCCGFQFCQERRPFAEEGCSVCSRGHVREAEGGALPACRPPELGGHAAATPWARLHRGRAQHTAARPVPQPVWADGRGVSSLGPPPAGALLGWLTRAPLPLSWSGCWRLRPCAPRSSWHCCTHNSGSGQSRWMRAYTSDSQPLGTQRWWR